MRTRPDLAVLGAGAWSATFCDEPGTAYANHLEDFLSYYAAELARNKVPPGQVLFMGTVPRPSCSPIHRAAHGRLLQFLDEVARLYSRNHGFSFFNPLEIAYPNVHFTCSSRDPHYTCVDKPGADNRIVPTGPVGEAMALTFLQLLFPDSG